MVKRNFFFVKKKSTGNSGACDAGDIFLSENFSC